MRGVGLRRGALDFSAALEMTRGRGLVCGDVSLLAGGREGGFESRLYCLLVGEGVGSVSGGTP